MSSAALATLVAQSAAKAVGGLAVRQAVPKVQAAAGKLRPAPTAVRRSELWPEVKLAKAKQEVIAAYIGGRLCTGLLEILALLEITGRAAEDERERLRQSFTWELADKLDLPEGERIAEALWSELRDCVRLNVVQLREKSALTGADLACVPGIGHDVHGALSSAVDERWQLSGHRERVSAAHQAIRGIREATRARYAKMVMPHSRDDYRVPIEKIYVPRLLSPRPDFGPAGDRAPDVTPVPEAELADRRFVVVGHPGAGKSTFIRHLLYRAAGPGADETPLAPMIVELKDHPAPADSYLGILADTVKPAAQIEPGPSTVGDILRLGLAVVVFDGLDEIVDIEMRRSAADGIEAFCRRYPLVTVVVTSREEGYARARLDPARFPVYHLPDFTQEQLELYVQRWFRIVARPRQGRPEERARNFLEDSVHVSDLRTNPLMLSLLCMIYEYEGYIPENRPRVYEECAELLFERWDKVRRVPVSFKTNEQTKYLVQELAHRFFTDDGSAGGLPEDKLKQNIKEYFERNVVDDAESASSQARDFLEFCAGRAWLLAQTGTSERGERLFGFTHRTFLEYFAACYLVRHCDSAADLVQRIRPLIRSTVSEVVPQIAIQQFDLRRAGGIDRCLELLVLEASDRNAVYVEFALRSLRFMRPTPRAIERLYTAAIKGYGRKPQTRLLTLLLSCPARTLPIMRRCCESILAGNSSGYDEFGAAAVGRLLAELETGADPDELAECLAPGTRLVDETLHAGAERISTSHPATLVELCCAGSIGIAQFLRAMGPRALVSVPDRRGHGDAPGPVPDLLRTLFTTNEFSVVLDLMLEQLAEGPEFVLPLGASVLAELTDLGRPEPAVLTEGIGAGFGPAAVRPDYDDAVAYLLSTNDAPGVPEPWQQPELRSPFDADAVLRHFPLGTTPHLCSVGFYLLFVAVMLASYEHDGEAGSAWRLIGTNLPGLDEILRRRTQTDRFTGLALGHEELGECVVEFAANLGCSKPWLRWFEDWTHGDVAAFGQSVR